MSAITREIRTPTSASVTIPRKLVRETIDGISFYHKGFRKVLDKTKTLDDIMADSGLQIFIKDYLNELLKKGLDTTQYWVFMGEIGSHLGHKNNMSLDVVVYHKTDLSVQQLTNKYIQAVPKLVVEIDVNVELEDEGGNLFEDYILRKIRRLHAFGVVRLVWVFTKSKTIIISTPDENWKVVDWDNNLELMNNISFNLGAYFKQMGLEI